MIGFAVRSDEVTRIQQQKVEFINLEVVLKGVPTWQKQEGTVANFIAKQSEQTRMKTTQSE
jgi:hypothetical protein